MCAYSTWASAAGRVLNSSSIKAATATNEKRGNSAGIAIVAWWSLMKLCYRCSKGAVVTDSQMVVCPNCNTHHLTNNMAR